MSSQRRTAKEKLGIKAKGRDVIGTDGSYALREDTASCKSLLVHEKVVLNPENRFFWTDTF